MINLQGRLRRLLRQRSMESSRRCCDHCGYEEHGVGVAPASCPRCGQVLRFIA